MISTLTVSNNDDFVSGLSEIFESLTKVNYHGYASSLSMAESIIKKSEIDLLAIDLDILEKDKKKWLKSIAIYKYELIVIQKDQGFYNELIDFCISGFLSVHDTILEFEKALNRVQKKLEQKKENEERIQNLSKVISQTQNIKLSINTKEGLEIIHTLDIVSIKVLKRSAEISFTNRKPLIVNKTISEMERLTQDIGFLRVHKAYIVNLMQVKQYVKKDGGLIIMSDNSSLPISSTKKSRFKKQVQKIALS
jgi:two-component system LytT family response regulator